MLKKGLKQVGDVHCNACLHPYFTLMCDSTAIMMIPLPINYRSESDMLLSYTWKWSRDVDMHNCGGHHQLISVLFRYPYLTLFFFLKTFFSYSTCLICYKGKAWQHCTCFQWCDVQLNPAWFPVKPPLSWNGLAKMITFPARNRNTVPTDSLGICCWAWDYFRSTLAFYGAVRSHIGNWSEEFREEAKPEARTCHVTDNWYVIAIADLCTYASK